MSIFTAFDTLLLTVKTDIKYCSKELLFMISNLVKQYDEDSITLFGKPINKFEKDYFNKIGSKLIYSRDYYKIDKDKINYGKIDKLCREGRVRNKHLKLLFYDMIKTKINEDSFLAFVKIVNNFSKEQYEKYYDDEFQKIENEVFRKSYIDKKQKNITEYVYMLFTKTNVSIGFTRVLINKSAVPRIYQLTTGVKKEYRGCGIASWIKAEVMKKICNDFPAIENIITSTDKRNSIMNHINKQFGYEFTHTVEDYKIEIAELTIKQKKEIT